MRKIVIKNPRSKWLVYDTTNRKRYTVVYSESEAIKLTERLNRSAGFERYEYIGILYEDA